MNQTTHKPISGSCLCARVAFTVRGPFQSFYICHCNRCQKITGTASAANIFAKSGSLNWLSGQKSVRAFALSKDTYFNAAFCDNCGSPVPRKAKSGDFIIIPAGCLDDDPGVRPDKIIFWEDRACWNGGPATAPDPSHQPSFHDRSNHV